MSHSSLKGLHSTAARRSCSRLLLRSSSFEAASLLVPALVRSARSSHSLLSEALSRSLSPLVVVLVCRACRCQRLRRRSSSSSMSCSSSSEAASRLVVAFVVALAFACLSRSFVALFDVGGSVATRCRSRLSRLSSSEAALLLVVVLSVALVVVEGCVGACRCIRRCPCLRLFVALVCHALSHRRLCCC